MNLQKSWNQTAREFYSKTLSSKLKSETYQAFVLGYQQITKRIEFRPGLKIADLGSGTGYLVSALKNLSLKIVGVDISTESLKAAKERNPASLFINGDLLSLPIKEKSIDVAVALTSIEFCFDRKKAILEANKILKPGGKFYMEVRNRDFILFKMLRPIYPLLSALKLIAPYKAETFQDLSFEEWRVMLQSSGFNVQKTYTALRPWNFGSIVTRIKNSVIRLIQIITPLKYHYMNAFVCVKP